RDAAPRIQVVDDALRALASVADLAPLPAAVASSLRCENAVAVDRIRGTPEATLRCALPGFEWIGAAAQAAAWGASTAPVRVRVAALQAIRSSAHGQAQVLEAVSEAAVQLPAPAAVPLIRVLGGERDPGVLAALLDGLVLHVQHARLLGPAERAALERAPFELPEGPSLEARQSALALARLVGDPQPGEPGMTRALRQTWQPDAAVTPMTRAIPSDIPPHHLRFAMDIGSFDVRIEPSSAPEATAAIVGAARTHRYDGLTFHRVVPGFVAQGLDPRGDGYGGTDQPVRTELSIRHFERGSVGIPLAGLDTGGIQLFVVLADAPHLDGRYPWVGQVERGMDVVDGLLPQDHVVRVEVLEGE
ncbi:MAG: peptidylprolyl isomerase, partial [Deltaproteobacteria bacterium]